MSSTRTCSLLMVAIAIVFVTMLPSCDRDSKTFRATTVTAIAQPGFTRPHPAAQSIVLGHGDSAVTVACWLNGSLFISRSNMKIYVLCRTIINNKLRLPVMTSMVIDGPRLPRTRRLVSSASINEIQSDELHYQRLVEFDIICDTSNVPINMDGGKKCAMFVTIELAGISDAVSLGPSDFSIYASRR